MFDLPVIVGFSVDVVILVDVIEILVLVEKVGVVLGITLVLCMGTIFVSIPKLRVQTSLRIGYVFDGVRYLPPFITKPLLYLALRDSAKHYEFINNGSSIHRVPVSTTRQVQWVFDIEADAEAGFSISFWC